MGRLRPGTDKLRPREIFFAYNGPGPYGCCFCDEPVSLQDWGNHGAALSIHHVDEDRGNNGVENLAPCHKRCHTRHHAKARGLGMKLGGRHSDAYRETIRRRRAEALAAEGGVT